MTDQADLFNPSKPPFGMPPHQLHRLDAPATSVTAAYTVDSKGDERRVFDRVREAGQHGMTLKECAYQMGKQLNQISGRFSALLEKGRIADTGDRRQRCRVYRVKQ